MKKIKISIIFVLCAMSNQLFAQQNNSNIFELINNNFGFGLYGQYVNERMEVNHVASSVGINLDYNGKLVSGPGLSFDWRRSFQEKIYFDLYLNYMFVVVDVGGKLGYIFNSSPSLQTMPYVGLKVFAIWRSGYEAAVGGLRFNWLLKDKLILSPYIEGGVSKPADDKIFGKEYHFQGRPIIGAGLELDYKINRKTFLIGFITFNHVVYRSKTNIDSYVTGNFNEAKIGIGFRFI